MNCLKCNTDIPEGLLYCPKCGEEIRIVPDFEPEIDESISKAINDVASVVDNAVQENSQLNSDNIVLSKTQEVVIQKKSNPEYDDKIITKKNSKNKKESKQLSFIKIVAFSCGTIFFIVLGIIVGINISRNYSFDYQYENALKMYEIGDYEAAATISKKAVNLDKDDKAARLLLSDSYYNIGKYDESIAVLEEMIGLSDDRLIQEKLITDYEALNDYNSIKELLVKIDSPDLNVKYAEYLAPDPSFSLESGTYSDSASIEITDVGSGTIYYTTDGSNPGKDSFIYSGPISLGEGITVLSAMFINDKGICSNVVTANYEVTTTVVNGVRLDTTAGKYSVPKLIKVDAVYGGKIYYTSDGSTPTDESTEYTKPILMPLGQSQYKFIVYDNGKSSDIVIADYTLNIEGFVDKTTAENAVQIRLMALGNVEAVTNHYLSNQGYGEGANCFYIVSEYKSDFKTLTGKMYAVDTRTGSIFNVNYNENAQKYDLSPI